MPTSLSKWDQVNKDFLKMMCAKGYYPFQNQDASMVTEKTFSGSIAGAPIRATNIAVVGMNWGGGGTSDSQKQYHWENLEPKYCGLADKFSSGSFGHQIFNIFSKIITVHESILHKVMKQNTFWTNRILTRTANATVQEKLQKDSADASAEAVAQMLSVVSPKLILCFGNGGGFSCPSAHFLTEPSTGDGWWKNGEEFEIPGSNTKARRFITSEVSRAGVPNIPDSCEIIWSFPHPSRGRDKILVENRSLIKRLKDDLIWHGLVEGHT